MKTDNTHEKQPQFDETEWWTDAEQVAQGMHLLCRAGILDESEPTCLREYLEKPWKWSKERNIAMKLEYFMAEHGVSASAGWSMSMSEVCSVGLR